MDMIKTIECEHCNQEYSIPLDSKDYERWQNGEALIQDALEYLSADNRELLISETCNTCFRRMFSED